MTGAEEHALAKVGSEPISESSPCGENIRYEPVFEQLEAELAKQESLSSETVDWKRVSDLSSEILKSSSKDMLVAAYLAQSLLINEGYSGLAVGLKILNDMVENHWDCLFPPAKRMRARATAVSWLAERAGAIISEKAPTANESEAVIEAAKFARLLDAELAEKMADSAPMVTDLTRPLKNYKQSAEAEKAQQAAKAEASSEAAPAVSPAASPAEAASDAAPSEQAAGTPDVTEAVTEAAAAPAAPVRPARTERSSRSSAAAVEVVDISSENDAKKALRQTQDAIRKVSSFWSASKLSDPRAYRVARMANWLMIEAAPPANDGVTQVMPPAADRVKALQTQIDKSEFSAVLPELEKTLARAPFWIDGQNMVVTVLRAMGAEYDKAADAVISELRHFLRRVPEVVELSFSDQTPFVADQTRMWLDSVVLAVGDAGAGGGSSVSGNAAGGAWHEAMAEARKKAASGDNAAAITIFSDGINSASMLRDKFYWRCGLAELLLQTGEAEASANILQPMTQQAENYLLDEWEPSLLARIYQLLYQSYLKQQGKKKDDESLNALVDSAYDRLCWFDPVTALTVRGEK